MEDKVLHKVQLPNLEAYWRTRSFELQSNIDDIKKIIEGNDMPEEMKCDIPNLRYDSYTKEEIIQAYKKTVSYEGLVSLRGTGLLISQMFEFLDGTHPSLKVDDIRQIKINKIIHEER